MFHCMTSRLRLLRPAVLNPVYTTEPVLNPVEQLVEQPAALCKQTFNRLSNRLFNRFEKRLYRVNGVLESGE